jgi:hypothetical protein
MAYNIISENGEYYIAVKTESQGIENTYTEFYYLYENPVTPEKTTETEVDPETGEETEVEVITYSKLEMRKEPIEYLKSGGNRVIKNLSGIDHWLIKMPKDFLIKREYQPGLNKPKAEEYNIGGSYQIRASSARGGSVIKTITVLPFIAKRVGDYLEQFVRQTVETDGTRSNDRDERRNRTRTKILNLLNQKYG